MDGPVLLSVEGVIGAGKSTFLKCMQEQLGKRVHIVLENVELWRKFPDPDNPTVTHNLLDSYYKDATKLAMPFQTLALTTRADALTRALACIDAMPREERPDIVLVERSAEGDACFAQMLHADGHIDDAWFAAYKFTQALLDRFVPSMHGIIDTGVSVSQAMTRLRARGRGEETSITTAYQEQLHNTLRAWIDRETRPILRLRTLSHDNAHTDATRMGACAEELLAFAERVRRGGGAHSR